MQKLIVFIVSIVFCPTLFAQDLEIDPDRRARLLKGYLDLKTFLDTAAKPVLFKEFDKDDPFKVFESFFKNWWYMQDMYARLCYRGLVDLNLSLYNSCAAVGDALIADIAPANVISVLTGFPLEAYTPQEIEEMNQFLSFILGEKTTIEEVLNRQLSPEKREILLDKLSLFMDGPLYANLELFSILPQQAAAFGIQATRTMAGHVSIASTSVLGRLESLHAGLDTVRYAGIQFYQDGRPMTGGNAGSEAFGPLGIWVNGNFHLGEVDSTPNLLGFNYKNWGVTLGADYKITDSLLFGGAFSYILSDSDFDHRTGHLDTDSYIGSLYGSYYLGNFYLDGLVHYGHINYDLVRDLDLAMPQDPSRNLAKSDTDGRLWGFTFSGGYHFHAGGLTFTPYIRASYQRLNVDGFRETANTLPLLRMEVGEQHVRSLKSIAGAQLAYAISLPWGVVGPQVRGEWHHEFRDPSRTIATKFINDVLQRVNPIRVPAPDRDYAVFGGDLVATFAQGVSAFVGYEALVGYRHVSSHKITGGIRVQF